MLELEWIGDLDGDAACAVAVEAQADLLRAEATRFYLAAHWADLHAGEALADERRRTGRRVLPGHGAGEAGRCGRDAVGGGVRGDGARCAARDGSRRRGPSRQGRVERAAPAPATVGGVGRGAGSGVAGPEGRPVVRGRRARPGPGPLGRRGDDAVRGVVAVGAVRVAGGGQDHRGRPRCCGGAGEGGGDGAVRAHRPVDRVRDQDAHRPRQRGGCDLLPGDGRPDRPDPAPEGRHGHRGCAAVQGGRDPRLSSSGARVAGVGRPTGCCGRRRCRRETTRTTAPATTATHADGDGAGAPAPTRMEATT